MINKAILVGYIEEKPTISIQGNGAPVANFVLVTEEKWKDPHSGTFKKVNRERHKVACFSEKLIEIIENSLDAGSVVGVEGRIESRMWKDTNGKTRYSIDIVIRPMRGTLYVVNDYYQEKPLPT